MVLTVELFGDNLANIYRSPHPSLESIRNRTAFNNIRKAFQLRLLESSRSATTMPFQECGFTVVIPTTNPVVNPGPMVGAA